VILLLFWLFKPSHKAEKSTGKFRTMSSVIVDD